MYAIIHTIEPFDMAKGTAINFTWNGNQIFKVRCIIKNNETGVTVYDNTISTMKQAYPLPAESGLVNGVYYVAYITVFDVNNKESDMQSIGMPFYCFSTPAFDLSIANGDIIKSSNYNVGLTYQQIEGEQLDSYRITLYSYQKSELQTSGLLYDTSDLSFIISELENAEQYYIRATGTTLHGMTLDTGYVLFTVAYAQTNVFSTLELNNRPAMGAIEIRSNIVSTEGHVVNPPVKYVEGGGIDVRDNEVIFDVGFEVSGDFTKVFKIQSPIINQNLITMKDLESNLIIDVIYRIGSYSSSDGIKGYFELVARTGIIHYIRMSNYIPIPTEDQSIVLYVIRKDKWWNLHAVVVEQKEVLSE